MTRSLVQPLVQSTQIVRALLIDLMYFKLVGVDWGPKSTNLIQAPVVKAQFQLTLHTSGFVLLVMDIFH